MVDRFVESPNVTRVDARAIDTVVVHTMEIGDRADAAEICARWFASPASQVSAHYCVDATTVIQCVREEDVAWHARGGNATSVGVELAGMAGQGARDWEDAYSLAVLARGAALVADVCRRHAIPVRRLGPPGLLARRRGITGHADVSEAFGMSDHWDPGPGFPWVAFLDRVRAAGSGPPAPVGAGARPRPRPRG
ncbi:MAG: N-acetylmuramoyl-L-alanine amidase [Gaiella sp.]